MLTWFFCIAITATLVEGPKDASLTYANADAEFTIGMQCAFSESTLAVCTIEAQGSTATQTEVITHQPIQGGGTLAVTGTASISVTTSRSGGSTTSITDPSTSFPAPGAASTQTPASPTTSSSSGSSGPKRGSAVLWGVGVVLPYLVSGPRLW
ncbi:hypothetical protein BJ912DRAFT_953972 [Pholiota molesta]|nr:hypothetical protein BJ912DRAFT_953972 [Pholiota molesta]